MFKTNNKSTKLPETIHEDDIRYFEDKLQRCWNKGLNCIRAEQQLTLLREVKENEKNGEC